MHIKLGRDICHLLSKTYSISSVIKLCLLMASSDESKAVSNFIAIGFALIGRLGDLRDQEGVSSVKDDLRSWQLQLQAAEELLQDEVGAAGLEETALRASLSVVRDLKVRLKICFTRLSGDSEAGKNQKVMDSAWPSDNLEDLGQRLSSIRTLLR